MKHYTFVQLAQCARRELGKRQFVYAKLVREGRMSQSQADEEITMMIRIAEHFELLSDTKHPST